MENNIRSVDYYKDILRQAAQHAEHLSVKSKQQILQFKDKLQEYIKLVDSYSARPIDISADQPWEEGIETETQMGLLHEDLDRMGNEILKELALVKDAFK